MADGVENLFKLGICNVRVFLMETNPRKSLSPLNFVAIMFQSDVRMGNVLLDMDAVYNHGIVHEIRIIVWT